MRTIVIGGTGLLGYHSVNHLLANGHDVTVLSLPPKPEGMFPDSVAIELADLDEMSDSDLDAVMAGHETDPPPMPKNELEPFLESINVTMTQRSLASARNAGVSRAVVLGSYFAYFDRIWPNLRIAGRHPYVGSRLRQTQAAFDLTTDDFGVVVLELPYIWGTMPNRSPQWEQLIKTLRGDGGPIHHAPGGTMMTSVLHVAEAVLGGLERGVPGHRYPIGDQNVTWAELIAKIGAIDGVERRVVTTRHAQLRAAARETAQQLEAAGLDVGIRPVPYVDIQCANAFFDPEPSRIGLGLTSGGLDEAIREQVEMCPI
ncbi:MAG: NAD-dependent epimerase/dehydratase family protein [Actinobacteria bacterium]|nr:NAD-dependent epimerase/dehydratase family protein [Actinomycetota bacterium]